VGFGVVLDVALGVAETDVFCRAGVEVAHVADAAGALVSSLIKLDGAGEGMERTPEVEDDGGVGVGTSILIDIRKRDLKEGVDVVVAELDGIPGVVGAEGKGGAGVAGEAAPGLRNMDVRIGVREAEEFGDRDPRRIPMDTVEEGGGEGIGSRTGEDAGTEVLNGGSTPASAPEPAPAPAPTPALDPGPAASAGGKRGPLP
jgi:hypothetical protein